MTWFRCCGSSGSGSEVISQLAERVSSPSSRIVTSSDASTSRPGWCAFNGIHPTNLREPEANTYWFAASDDATPYIQYDLLNSYRLSQVRIDCFSNYDGAWTGNIEVLGSTDGSSWTNILQTGASIHIEAALQSITNIVIDLNSTSFWRYIRIKGESAFDVPFAPSLFIDEIFIYGYVIETAKVKQSTFVSATSQYGIVDVDCGFKPDMVMVKLPFGNNDTTAYWEKGVSWAETKSIWNLFPAESVVYVVDLGRQSGETGIQAINDNGFSFMSNGANTQGITCEYIAVKY